MDKNGKEKMLEKVEKKAVKKAAKKAVKKDVKQGKYSSVSHMAIRESPYLKTILDPVNNVGVKIPDEVTTPSFTVQVLTKFVVTSNTGAGGNTGCGFWRILGGSSVAVGQATLAASATANQYAATGATNPWATQFNTQCASMRLVSAKCTMTYLGSPNNASGRFLIAFISPYNLMTTVSGNVALSGAGAGQNLLQNDKLVDVPASKLYAECRYVPLDPIARSYETSGSSAYSTLRGSGNLTYGQFIGILDGCPVSQNVEVNIWENFECVPQTNLVNLVQPTPSLSDPLEMAAASNVLSSVPQVATMQTLDDVLGGTAQTAPQSLGNSATATKAPSVTESSDVPFMDKVMKGAGSLIDAGKKAVPLITEIAAML